MLNNYEPLAEKHLLISKLYSSINETNRIVSELAKHNVSVEYSIDPWARRLGEELITCPELILNIEEVEDA